LGRVILGLRIKCLFYILILNASYGAENLVVLTTITNSRGCIMSKDSKDDFTLFIQIVSFSKFGDGVIRTNNRNL